MDRRNFLKAMGAFGAVQILPGCFSPKAYNANGKVRLAVIGVGQQGWYDIRQFLGRLSQINDCDFAKDASDICELVAMCDTDMGSEPTLPAIKAFPNVPRYRDFRVMFDKEADNIDAVLVSIPDFSHFPAAMAAMKLGKAVYCEKPLAHTFEECALLMAAAEKYGVVTQMGNQGHSSNKYFQHKEYFEKGIVKDVFKVNVHMNNERRWHKYRGNIFEYPVGEDIPATLDYDTWLGTARYHEYSSAYMCGEWRCWYDFGCGCLGDWGAHTLDCVHEFLLKGDLPTRIELKKCEGWNQFCYPCAVTLRMLFPKNALHDEIELNWFDGVDNHPELPEGFVYDQPWGIPANSANVESEAKRKKLFPGKEMYQKDGTVWQSLSHCHPLHRVGDYDAKLPDYPKEGDSHYRLFIRAVKGEVKTTSPFSIGGRISQLFALGNIAQRVNRSIEFDPVKNEIVGDEYASYFLKGPAPRKGWEDFYRI